MRHQRPKNTRVAPAKKKVRQFHGESNLTAFLITIHEEAENPDWLVGAY